VETKYSMGVWDPVVNIKVVSGLYGPSPMGEWTQRCIMYAAKNAEILFNLKVSYFLPLGSFLNCLAYFFLAPTP